MYQQIEHNKQMWRDQHHMGQKQVHSDMQLDSTVKLEELPEDEVCA